MKQEDLIEAEKFLFTQSRVLYVHPNHEVAAREAIAQLIFESRRDTRSLVRQMRGLLSRARADLIEVYGNTELTKDIQEVLEDLQGRTEKEAETGINQRIKLIEDHIRAVEKQVIELCNFLGKNKV